MEQESFSVLDKMKRKKKGVPGGRTEETV